MHEAFWNGLFGRSRSISAATSALTGGRPDRCG
jgi:hypothetical protein